MTTPNTDTPLAPCPCGEVPDSLIVCEGRLGSEAMVSGNCCDEWSVEFRINYKDPYSPEGYALAVEAWNGAKKMSPIKLAERFHETYERLAPLFGYETREETPEFVPGSPNGKLMVAVCYEILHGRAIAALEREGGVG